jgi:rhodanese-related sulfurtransferase
MSATELKAWQDEARDFVLIDVLPPEYYGEKHIKGALNAAVYEVVFLERVKKIIEDPKKTIVVYDSSTKSLASETAAEKLAKAGYKNVYNFSEGLSEWEKMGYPVETGKKAEASLEVDNKNFSLDLEKSILEWTGRNRIKKHYGTINIKKGEIAFEDGKVKGGEFTLDMKSIKDIDLTDENYRKILERHLHSDDFFDTENYSEASLKILEATPIAEATPGMVNYKIRGELLLHGVKRELEFPAMISIIEDGTISAEANFDFDRTLWNVNYGSGRMYEKLGMHLVNDRVSVELFLFFKQGIIPV